jgi:hypothetical protein
MKMPLQNDASAMFSVSNTIVGLATAGFGRDFGKAIFRWSGAPETQSTAIKIEKAW